MAGVFKRGQTWWLRFTVNGKQVRRSAETRNKREAEALLAKFRAQVHTSTYFAEARDASVTFGAVADAWLEHSKRTKRSWASDVARVERLTWFFGEDRLLSSIGPGDVRDLMDALQEARSKRGGKKPLTPASVNLHLNALKAIVKLAEGDGALWRGGKVPLLRLRNARDRIPTEDEIERLCEAATPPLALTIRLLHWTGARLAEVCGLEWSRIDLKEGVFRLAAEHTKTAKARVVPLPPEAIATLKAWPRRIDGGRVFEPSWTSSNVSPQFSRLCKRVGVEGLRLHDLRHGVATRLRRAGVDTFTVMEILGHKDVATAKRYQTIGLDDLKAAVAKATDPRGKR